MKKINIGLIGFGNVGAGVVRILRERRSLIAERAGFEIDIRRICDKDITTRRKVKVNKELLTTRAGDIINDPQIDIVVELIGGTQAAGEFISESFKKGKHVVTANKALLAHDGPQVFAQAADRGKSIYFEASVGAGIPLIKSLREGLIANRFSSIYGILNGTSNFVLSRMAAENCSFQSALRDAKSRGFAEANPTLDIEGTDTAHKLVVLTYLTFGKFVPLKDVFVEGIAAVTLSDILYAEQMGYEIKLLAVAKKVHDELEVRVHPTLVPKSHLLSSVDGVFNAIYASCDLAGEMLFYGPGAGQLSAASAVVADIVDLTQDIKAGLFRQTLNIASDKSVRKLRPIKDHVSRYYLRLMVSDEPGVLARIAGILAKYKISIASVSQKERGKSKVVPVVMILHDAREKEFRSALTLINKLKIVKEPAVAVRIEDME
ncbi:MAG: homoserine dehydrogenase [Candidatus Omnitrophica bacterium]|nr:homoserine dehydrogenase [Candidatus Omnitrophota bacterium]